MRPAGEVSAEISTLSEARVMRKSMSFLIRGASGQVVGPYSSKCLRSASVPKAVRISESSWSDGSPPSSEAETRDFHPRTSKKAMNFSVASLKLESLIGPHRRVPAAAGAVSATDCALP